MQVLVGAEQLLFYELFWLEASFFAWNGHFGISKKMRRLQTTIKSSSLTDCLQTLSHNTNASTRAVFWCYFHVNYSFDFADFMPSLLLLLSCTRLSSFSYSYYFHLSNARVNQYSLSFIPFSVNLWNYLPVSVFTTSNGLKSCKREVSWHPSFDYFLRTLLWAGTSVSFFSIGLLLHLARFFPT